MTPTILKRRFWPFFYKKASVILPLFSLMFLVAGLMSDKFLKINEAVFWLTIILTQLIMFSICGKLIQNLRTETIRDPLTGLKNRRYFLDQLTTELERMKRTNSSISLAMIDIDDFKSVNDTYGHLTGDDVLKQLSKIFNEHTRAVDTVSR